jgi:6-pyruvoyltetrahydropterin/6-carboxytetrahydropterin synthase
MVYLSRKSHFSSAHRYYQPALSESENKKTFGRCYTPHGHGHNYQLEVTIQGEIDGKTGMVINLVDLDQIIKEVTTVLDHQHLNKDVAYFQEAKDSTGRTIVPTTENIAKYCWLEIKSRLPDNCKLSRVRIYEADDLWADYYG